MKKCNNFLCVEHMEKVPSGCFNQFFAGFKHDLCDKREHFDKIVKEKTASGKVKMFNSIKNKSFKQQYQGIGNKIKP